MNAENFAEWLRRQGHFVIKSESSYWYNAGPRVMQAFPYHWLITPSEDEINTLMRKNKLMALRYSTKLDAPIGTISYHAVYEEPDYKIEDLDRRSRQNVRKGLNNCVVEPISFERLAEEGWELEKDTLDRQDREGQYGHEEWRNRCLAAGEIPGFEAWGAIINGELAASLLSFQSGDCCELIFQQSRRKYLNDRANNALTFFVSQTMSRRSDIHSIFYALHSLDAPPEIDEYKFRMNYKPKPVKQRVAFNPLITPFVTGFSHKVIKWLHDKRPQSRQLAKAEGLFRFYLQGKLPISRQDWPSHMESSKDRILEEIKYIRSS